MKKPGVLAALALVALLLAAALPAAAAAKQREPVKVTPKDALYPVLVAFHEGTVEPGTTVGGCLIVPRTSCPGAKLAGHKLTGAILPASNLTGLHAHGAKLAGATLALSRLQGADLSEIEAPALIGSHGSFEDADFAGANLTLGGLARMRAPGADFHGADLHAADFSGADLRGADLRGAQMTGMLASGADLRGADLRGADLSLTDLHRADLRGARLGGAKFCSTIMPSGRVRSRRQGCLVPSSGQHGPAIEIPPQSALYTVLKATTQGNGPKLPGVRVRGCTIAPSSACPGGDIRGARLHGAFLSYARFPAADFRRAHLELGNLSFADMRGGQFQRAVLAGAAAVETDFANASMLGANLTLGDLVGAKLTRVDLRQADAREANMTKADLRHADLRHTRLGSAALVGADLRGARLGGTDLSEAVLVGAKLPASFPAGATLCNTIMPSGRVANLEKECEPGYSWIFSPRSSMATNLRSRRSRVSGFLASFSR